MILVAVTTIFWVSLLNKLYSSSSSVGATTLGGFWPVLRFRSTVINYITVANFGM
jgi:hypothetical protein